MAVQDNGETDERTNINSIKKYFGIRQFFIRNGFGFEEDRIRCIGGYVFQIILVVIFGVASGIFVINDTAVYQTLFLNGLSFLINVVSLVTAHFKLKKKFGTFGRFVPNQEKGVEFYAILVGWQLKVVATLIFGFIITSFSLPQDSYFVMTSIMKTFSVLFLFLCAVGNVEQILEKMYMVKIEEKRI